MTVCREGCLGRNILVGHCCAGNRRLRAYLSCNKSTLLLSRLASVVDGGDLYSDSEDDNSSARADTSSTYGQDVVNTVYQKVLRVQEDHDGIQNQEDIKGLVETSMLGVKNFSIRVCSLARDISFHV